MPCWLRCLLATRAPGEGLSPGPGAEASSSQGAESEGQRLHLGQQGRRGSSLPFGLAFPPALAPAHLLGPSWRGNIWKIPRKSLSGQPSSSCATEQGLHPQAEPQRTHPIQRSALAGPKTPEPGSYTQAAPTTCQAEAFCRQPPDTCLCTTHTHTHTPLSPSIPLELSRRAHTSCQNRRAPLVSPSSHPESPSSHPESSW